MRPQHSSAFKHVLPWASGTATRVPDVLPWMRPGAVPQAVAARILLTLILSSTCVVSGGWVGLDVTATHQLSDRTLARLDGLSNALDGLSGANRHIADKFLPILDGLSRDFRHGNIRTIENALRTVERLSGSIQVAAASAGLPAAHALFLAAKSLQNMRADVTLEIRAGPSVSVAMILAGMACIMCGFGFLAKALPSLLSACDCHSGRHRQREGFNKLDGPGRPAGAVEWLCSVRPSPTAAAATVALAVSLWSIYALRTLVTSINEVSVLDHAARRPCAADHVPVGAVLQFPTAELPSGFLPCDGRTVDRQRYPELFTLLRTAYGAGDERTTFGLPDYRGYFLRGADGRIVRTDAGVTEDLGHSSGRDPDRAARVPSNPNANVEPMVLDVGSQQDDAIAQHNHPVPGNLGLKYQYLASLVYDDLPAKTAIIVTSATKKNAGHPYTFLADAPHGPVGDHLGGDTRPSVETRPKNVYVVFGIKADGVEND